MTIFAKTTVAAITAASLMLGALTATTTTASAGSLSISPAVASLDADANLVTVGWKKHHHHGYAGPAAAGLVFGLATGAIIANSYRGPRCYWTVVKKKRWDRYGYPYFVKKQVKVCD